MRDYAEATKSDACRRHARCPSQWSGLRPVPLAALVKSYISFANKRKGLGDDAAVAQVRSCPQPISLASQACDRC